MSSSSGDLLEQPAVESGDPKDDASADPPPVSDYDEWEMEERLRHLDRVYARNPLSSPLSASGAQHLRIDTPHAARPRGQAIPNRPTQPRPSWLSRLGRLALDFGLAVTVCGGSLMAWAHFGARPNLWPLGVPIAIGGLILLLVGLVLQFDELDGEKSRPADREFDMKSQMTLGQSRLRFENESDNAPLLKDLAARLDEVTKRLEGSED